MAAPSNDSGTLINDIQGTATRLINGANQEARPININSGIIIATSSASWADKIGLRERPEVADNQGVNHQSRTPTATNDSQKPALSMASGWVMAMSNNAQAMHVNGCT